MVSSGRVVGIDVGWSERRKANALCLIDWDARAVRWKTELVGNEELEKRAALRRLCGGRPVAAVAIDGPLRPGLKVASDYRTAEAAFSRGLFRGRGRPGATSSPTGARLHAAATEWARFAADELQLAASGAPFSAHRNAVFEAFPNLFLYILRDDRAFGQKIARSRVVDELYREPAIIAKLTLLLRSALGERDGIAGFQAIGGHDRLAAACCAMTALAVVSGHYSAVGSPRDGFIALPPVRLWGAGARGGTWAKPAIDGILKQLAAEGWRPRLLS